MAALLEAKEYVIVLPSGEEKTYILSKFPAIAGREIIAKYPLSAMPKLGDYSVSEETMLKLMSYVAVPMPEGDPFRLTIRAAVDNHVPDWETLAKIEMAMMEYNCSFFRDGRISDTLEKFVQKVLRLISQTLTASSDQSSQMTKQP